MKKLSGKILIIALLLGMGNISFADRGAGKKSKAKTLLNINTNNTSLKSSLSLNIKSGLAYKGSVLAGLRTSSNTIISSTLLTYQKGNTTYIIPFKQKITVPEIRQGYTGLKMIIRRR